ncbi:MAG: hypothetical protein IPF54_13850 [Draconibacterium sp.]|nr:hypothetical protein [Draconibacterium sp.]
MKHRTTTNQEITHIMSHNFSGENFLSDYSVSNNKNTIVKLSCGKVPFVVEWQMENNKNDISIK